MLAGYIAYAIAGRPGLVPGFIGGYFCTPHAQGEKTAGFLGAIVIGLLAGWVVELIKKGPVHKYVKPIMPILVIPVISSLIIGVIMIKVVGPPIIHLNMAMSDWLTAMSTGNAVILAMILGGMIAFDMGGPVNKAAFFFSSAPIAQNSYAAMGACRAAICTPPIGRDWRRCSGGRCGRRKNAKQARQGWPWAWLASPKERFRLPPPTPFG